MISTPSGAAAASLAPDTESAIDPVLRGAVPPSRSVLDVWHKAMLTA